ncbi:hypothetical protein KR018_005831 [Drosophila ironensis]|nr:hypothetical protein KR018_005831 [Drosophila ironensis]
MEDKQTGKVTPGAVSNHREEQPEKEPPKSSNGESDSGEETPEKPGKRAGQEEPQDAEKSEEQETPKQPTAYSMRPAFGEMFPLPIVKNIMNSVMTDKLKDKTYDQGVAKQWTSEIADEINMQIASNPKVKDYKHVVQVMLGQELGAGATYNSRCCWDCDCDTTVSEIYSNTSMFCVCTVFGTYQY